MSFGAHLRASGRCRLCARPLDRDASGDICGAPICQTRAQVEAQGQLGKKASERKKREEAQRKARLAPLFDELARRLGVDDISEIPKTVTPHIRPSVIERSAREVAEFTHHLTEIVEHAFSDRPIPLGEAARRLPEEVRERLQPDELPTPEIRQMAYELRDAETDDDPLALDASCIACGGNCCTTGLRYRAYLEAFDIAYYRHHHPGATPASVLGDYLSRIPAKSLANSCLYLTETGCHLPRALRSTTCNGWHCSARKTLARQLEEKGPERSAVIGIATNQGEYPEEDGVSFRAVTISDGVVQVHDDLRLPAIPDLPEE